MFSDQKTAVRKVVNVRAAAGRELPHDLPGQPNIVPVLGQMCRMI